MKKNLLLVDENVKRKIYTIRGLQVLLDRDLAELYGVETKVLNQAVKRNLERFPRSFMFQLSNSECENLKSQIVTSSHGGRRTHPYVFIEQGVAMLSGVLKSKTAIRTSLQIMQTFVSMRRFIAENADVFFRLEKMERKQIEYDEKFNEVFEAIRNKDLKPEKGIFFEGQVFDAYAFVSDIIRTAKVSIVLVDNYVDDSSLTMLSKRNKNVHVTIFTGDTSKKLRLDLNKYSEQYGAVEVKEFALSHDRFLIIDSKDIYHFGASLKDLGKKWFAFSKMNKEAFILLEKLGI